MTDQEFEALDREYTQRYGGPKTPSSGATIDDFDRGVKEIRARNAQATRKEEQSKGFVSRTAEDLKGRGSEIYSTFGEAARGEITPVETGIRVVGQAAGGVGDVVGEAARSAWRTFVPDIVKEKGKEAVKAVLGGEQGVEAAKELVSKPIKAYQEFAEAHPRVAKTAEGVANIASLLPEGRAGQVAAKAAAPVAREAVEAAAAKVAPAAAKNLESQYGKIVRLTRKAKQAEAEWGKNTPKLLAEEGGVKLGVLQDGTLDTMEEAVPSIKEKLKSSSDAVKSLIKDSGAYGNIDEAERLALASIEKDRALGTVFNKKTEQIKKEFDAIRENYKGSIVRNDKGDAMLPIHIVDDAKSGSWNRAFEGAPMTTEKAAKDTDFAIGKSLQKTVEDAIPDADVKSMYRKIGDYAEALDVLRGAHGMVLPGGKIGKYLLQGVSATTAAIMGGGPIGGAGALYLAGKLADVMAHPEIRTSILKDVLRKSGMAKDAAEDIVKKASAILEERAKSRAAIPKIPESVPYRPPTVIEMPGRGIPDTTPPAGFQFKPSPTPKTVEQMRLESLDEAMAALRSGDNEKAMSNLALIRTMETDLPRAAQEAPNLMNPRYLSGMEGAPVPETVEIQKRGAEKMNAAIPNRSRSAKAPRKTPR